MSGSDQQLQFSWSNEPANETTAASPEPVVLRWDFQKTFPKPLPEAFMALAEDVSKMSDDEIRSIHEEHARHCLAILSDLDIAQAALKTGTDPRTGKPPRTEKARQKLGWKLTSALASLPKEFDEMLGAYGSAFGDEAASAFRKALKAWHDGVMQYHID